MIFRASHQPFGLIKKQYIKFRFINCWKCGKYVEDDEAFCAHSDCGVVQSIKLGDIDPFRLFKISKKYAIDIRKLDSEFKQLQMTLHPDKFATKTVYEREASAITSSTVNQAYQLLKSPLHRAQFMILSEFNINVFDDAITLCGEDTGCLMMEIFELREIISEEHDQNRLLLLSSDVKKILAKQQEDLTRSLEEKDKSSCCSLAIKLKYYCKISEEIEDKLQ